jgi:hypothetical protein
MKEPRIDEKTREYMRLWGRGEVPTAQITGGKIEPGTYPALATLGWIERRGPVALVGVHFLMLQRQAHKAMATLSLGMPVTKRTELLVNSFLHYIGWDGRVWPYDADGGWPEKSEEDCAQIEALLAKLYPKISSTLTFPSKPELGAKLIELPVLKRTAPYPLAPFEPVPESESPPVEHLDRFRELCQDPSPFQPSN